MCLHAVASATTAILAGKRPENYRDSYRIQKNFGHGLLTDEVSRPRLQVWNASIMAEYGRKAFATIDTTIRYYDLNELLQFRKWRSVDAMDDNLWTLANREPLERYPDMGSGVVWSGRKVIAACVDIEFPHPNTIAHDED